MKQTILIADDDLELTEVLHDLLDAVGYSVLVAHEGVTVVEKAKQFRPQLILLDWKMPLGKGPAVIEMLQEKEETKSIPVIVLTGVDEPGMKETLQVMGVRGYIKKPYEPSELIRKIKDVLAA